MADAHDLSDGPELAVTETLEKAAKTDIQAHVLGLRQSLDTIGAFLGPLAAIGLMWLTANHFTAVFWIAVIPAFLSFALITVAVHEPERPKELRRVRMPLSRAGARPHLASVF